MKTRPILRHHAAAVFATALFFVHHAALACPGCKQAVGGDGAGGSRAVNGVGVGYALSIGMLLLTVAGVLTALGYMMYRNCLIIAAQQQAAMAAEDASGDFSGGMFSAAGRA